MIVTSSLSDARNCIQRMLSHVELADYRGYDPYDALNSPIVRRLGTGSKWVRIGFTQLLKRSPVNLRPLLGVEKGHNPKAIGLFIWGYTRLYSLDKDARFLERIDYLLDLLERLRSVGCPGHSWGYNFDWQSRTFLRRRGTPTVVNTAFIGHALLDCYRITGRQRALDLALPIQDFILNGLRRVHYGDAFCFTYTPVDTEAVHNANLLGASVLARLTRYSGDSQLMEAISRSLKYSMDRQREDGSWFYAETPIQSWIDSFHTGFNMQAIRYILQAGLAQEWRPAYRKGVAYYASRFFLSDGTPKYYHDRVHPIDIHSPAQAISFFSTEGAEYDRLTDGLVRWMLTNMYDGRGGFYYRRTRWSVNRILYMRWSQAWVFHALTEYICSRSERSSDGDDGVSHRAHSSGCAHNMLQVTHACRSAYHADNQKQGKDVLCRHQPREDLSRT